MATPDELSRASIGRPSIGRRGAPMPVAAVVAALLASLLSYAPIAALTGAATFGLGTRIAAVARTAASIWLLGHGVPVQTATDRISLVPLTLTALIAWRLVRAGVHASRAVGGHRGRGPWRALGASAAAAVCYTAFAVAVAAAIHAPVARTAVTVGAVAAVCTMLGAVSNSAAGRSLLRRIPAPVRAAARTGLVAALLMLAAGAALAGVALARSGGDAADMLSSYRAGVLGQAGITVACLAYAPNAAIWATAYLLGPGFAVGLDTTVSPTVVLIGPLPALPVLTGLPSGPLHGPATLLLGVPIAAGFVAGWLLRRRGGPGWVTLVSAALLAGPVAGVLIQAAALASAGGLGSGRLAQLGPAGWSVGMLAGAVVAVGCVVGAVAGRALLREGPE